MRIFFVLILLISSVFGDYYKNGAISNQEFSFINNPLFLSKFENYKGFSIVGDFDTSIYIKSAFLYENILFTADFDSSDLVKNSLSYSSNIDLSNRLGFVLNRDNKTKLYSYDFNYLWLSKYLNVAYSCYDFTGKALNRLSLSTDILDFINLGFSKDFVGYDFMDKDYLFEYAMSIRLKTGLGMNFSCSFDKDFNFDDNINFSLSMPIGNRSNFGVSMNSEKYREPSYKYSLSAFSAPKKYDTGRKYWYVWAVPSVLTRKKMFFSKKETMFSILKKLNDIKEDPKCTGLLLYINPLSLSLANVEEIKSAIKALKDKGKAVVSYVNSGGTKELYFGGVANKIYANPGGFYVFRYPHFETMFYKGLFDKIGVNFQYVRFSEYKSAVEPYSKDSSTVSSKINKVELLSGLRNLLLKNSDIDFDRLTKRGMATGQWLKENNFVDDTSYYSDLISLMKKKNHIKFKNFSKMDYIYPTLKSRGKIAVIDFNGEIIDGRSRNTIFGKKYLGNISFIRLLQSVAKKKSVKGIVIEMNSPGGSSVASDIIYHEMKKIKKPIYIHIGSLGASGAYYSACGAKKIFANIYSIVGSIGIFVYKPHIDSFYRKVGLNKEIIKLSKNDALFSTAAPWDSSQINIIRENLRSGYMRFKSIVAHSRKLSMDSVEVLARGRVYTSFIAKKNGLIDSITTLQGTINALKKVLPKGSYSVEHYGSSNYFNDINERFISKNYIKNEIDFMKDYYLNCRSLMLSPDLRLE